MKSLNLLLLDDTITGTSTTWYSPVPFYDELGKHDQIGIQADIGTVSGTSPTLDVAVEHSADGQHWMPTSPGAAEISHLIEQNTTYYGYLFGLNPIPLGLVRFKVTLSGTNPQCRLKLSATFRDY